MAQPDVIITAPLPPFLYDPLKAEYRCHDYQQASDKPALLAAEGPRIRGLVQGGGTVTPISLLDALPKLEIISVFGVGYDGVPVDYCRSRGIKVTNTPDVLTGDVADVALALIMMTGRGFVRLNRFVHAGEWEKRGPPLNTKLSGKRVGILGLGRIGKAIADRVSALGMKVSYTGRKPQDVPYHFVPDLVGLAAESDYLVVSCPGGAATKNIVNAAVLAALGKKGTIVNIARGSIIDEPALVAALQAGTIGGAGLDVFADEPHVPAPLLAMDNVVLLPHVGSATHETRKAMGDLCKANLDAWFAGRPLPTLIPELADLPPSGPNQGDGSEAVAGGATFCFGWNSTAKSDASTSASAVNSAAPGRSPRNSMPANTPTTGTGSEESDDTATGSVRASVNHAQRASVPARKML